MDTTIILIFVGFIFTGFIIGYPLGVVMERRHERRHFFDGYKSADTVAVEERPRLKLCREDSILNAQILEDKSRGR